MNLSALKWVIMLFLLPAVRSRKKLQLMCVKMQILALIIGLFLNQTAWYHSVQWRTTRLEHASALNSSKLSTMMNWLSLALYHQVRLDPWYYFCHWGSKGHKGWDVVFLQYQIKELRRTIQRTVLLCIHQSKLPVHPAPSKQQPQRGRRLWVKEIDQEFGKG